MVGLFPTPHRMTRMLSITPEEWPESRQVHHCLNQDTALRQQNTEMSLRIEPGGDHRVVTLTQWNSDGGWMGQ